MIVSIGFDIEKKTMTATQRIRQQCYQDPLQIPAKSLPKILQNRIKAILDALQNRSTTHPRAQKIEKF